MIAVSDIEAVDETMIATGITIDAATMIVGGHVNGADHVKDHLVTGQGAVHQNPIFMVATRIRVFI